MSITYLAAKDEHFTIANTAWLASASAQGLPYTPQLYFPGGLPLPPNIVQIFAVCSFVVVTEHQNAVGRNENKAQYESIGLLAVQVFSPKVDPTALRIAETLASAVRD